MSYAQQPLDDFRGDHLSLRMFGAKGDTKLCTVATTSGSLDVIASEIGIFTMPTPASKNVPADPGDVGKRIVIYGAASSGRETHLTSATVGSYGVSDSYTVAVSFDTLGIATRIGFAGNCSTFGVTWQIFGSNSPSYSGEVSVHGPTAIASLATSDSYTENPPTYRYYRIKVKNSTPGSNGVFFGTCVAWGYVLGARIVNVSSSTQATLDIAPGNTISATEAYFGTDDTDAIQSAIDAANGLVVPAASADGGYNLWAPSGRYLISSPINHKKCVSLRGNHGGGSIFYADAASMTVSVPIWNMTGTFASDAEIGFYTRLEDVRLDCRHVPGSIGILCDALQENAGLYRTTVINWLQYGVQASTATDQFGCDNWVIEDPWIYPSNAAFLDDSVVGYAQDFAVGTTMNRGTFLGQGGFICGYGKGIEVSHGPLWAKGQIHIESARIGVHWNTGSIGSCQGLDTFVNVKNGTQIDSGNMVVVEDATSLGAVTILDNIQLNTIAQSQISRYTCIPTRFVETIAGALQMNANIDAGGPNIITLDSLNFGTDRQGGWMNVNSRYAGFPNWAQTSSSLTYTKAMFLRLAAAMFQVRIGNATNAGGVNPGTDYLTVDDGIGGARTPRLYFDAGGFGPMEFGNNLDVNRTRWQQGTTAQQVMVFQKSHDSGSTWQDVFMVDLVSGNLFFPNGADFASGGPFGSGIYSGTGDPNSVVTAYPGSVYLDLNGAVWFKKTGVGNTGWNQADAGFWQLLSAGVIEPATGITSINIPFLTASRPVKTDASDNLITGLINLLSANDVSYGATGFPIGSGSGAFSNQAFGLTGNFIGAQTNFTGLNIVTSSSSTSITYVDNLTPPGGPFTAFTTTTTTVVTSVSAITGVNIPDVHTYSAVKGLVQ